MAPLLIKGFVYLCCFCGFVRPFWAICGYLFLVFLQPEWIWRFEGLDRLDFSYQKKIIICITIGVFFNLSDGNGFWRKPLLALSGGALVFITWLSSFISNNPQMSELYFDVLWKSVLIMMFLFHLTDSLKKFVFVFGAMTLGCFYNAYRMHDDYVSIGWCRWVRDSWGYKGDSNVICLFEMPCLAFSLCLFFFTKSIYLRVFALLSTFILVHQSFILESRGAMLGIAVMALIVFGSIRKTPKVFFLTFCLSVAVIFVAGPPVLNEFSSIFAEKEVRDVSAESRFMLWSAALRIAIDHPLLGVGPYGGQFVIPQYEPMYKDLFAKHPHNIFLEVASGCGLIALTAFCTICMMPVFAAMRLRKKFRRVREPDLEFLTLVPLVGVPGIALTGFFCGSGMMESIYYFVGISMGGLASYERWLDNRLAEDATLETSDPQPLDYVFDEEETALSGV